MMVFSDELLNELSSDTDKVNEVFIADIKNFNRQLKKAYDKQSKLDNDYYEGNLESSIFNRLMSDLEKEIDRLKRNIRRAESEITKNESSINKDEIIYTLKNFNEFFEIVSDEEKKLLVRSLIKEIQMEENRKDIKKITFWFSSDSVLPSNKARRTVS